MPMLIVQNCTPLYRRTAERTQMPRKPNYRFERMERDKAKAAKRADRAAAKAAKAEARAGETPAEGEPEVEVTNE